MHKQGIYIIGTFRKDSFPGYLFEEKFPQIKIARGTPGEWVTFVAHGPMSIVTWHDNQIVTYGWSGSKDPHTGRHHIQIKSKK